MKEVTESSSGQVPLGLLGMLDFVAAGILVFDADLRVLYWNTNLEAWTGVGRQEVLGQDLVGRFPTLDPEHLRRELQDIFTGNSLSGVETELLDALHQDSAEDAPAVTLEGTLVLGPWANGKPCAIFTVHDVTALRLACDVAQAEVAERVAAEEALKRARDEAEAAANAKSEFLAYMSHEVRTPLNGILGGTALLLDEALPESQQALVSTAHRAAEALLAVVDDILDLSRLEAGQLPLVMATVDLHLVVQEVIDLFAPKAQTKGLALQLELAADLPRKISTDGNRLRQVLSNLVGNAVKFTDAGSVTLAVERDPVGLRFAVRDTGIGIPATLLSKLFGRFQQLADGERSRGGSGLGLSICRALVERMGGSMEVDTEEGKGSCFRFALPVVEVEDTDTPQVEVANPYESFAAPAGALPVLIVDDNSVNRFVASNILRKAGYTFEQAEDGHQALKHLEEKRFGVVLMDCLMPGIDGFETTRILRARGHTEIVVAMTANALQKDRELCIEAGMDHFLAKPVRPAVLLTLLRNVYDEML